MGDDDLDLCRYDWACRELVSVKGGRMEGWKDGGLTSCQKHSDGCYGHDKSCGPAEDFQVPGQG